MNTGAIIVLVLATIIDCSFVFVAFRDFLKKRD